MRTIITAFLIFLIIFGTVSADTDIPSLSLKDIVNKMLIAVEKWKSEVPEDMIETETGIRVPENFQEWLTGSIKASAELTDLALKWLKEYNNKVKNDEEVSWIIITWREPSENFIKALEAIGIKVVYTDDDINAVSVISKPSTIQKLVYSESFDFKYKFYIKEIWPDFYVSNSPFTVINISSNATQANITREVIANANWNIKLIKANLVWSKTGITGKNVVIAVLDTGVDCNHVMLQDACIKSVSFVDGEGPEDLNGHGTHVASIAAGRPVKATVDGETVYVSGVAPRAYVLNVKVLGKNGGGTIINIIQGLDYVAEWKKKHLGEKVVVSMSLGSPFGSPNDPLVKKVNQIVLEEHIPVIVAAGNEFIVIDTPGIAEGAITVAAVDRNMKVAAFSGKGPGVNALKDIKPDIAAPGVKIVAAKAGTKNQLVAMSGTSMATPHVSGVAALVLQKHDITPDTLRQILIKTAYQLEGINALPTWSGAGLVDAYAAVNAKPPEKGILDELKEVLGGE